MFIKGVSGVAMHPKLHTYEEGYLLPVLSSDELLFSHRHKGLLRLLRDLAGLSEGDFDHSYGQVLKNYMEFCQVLPHKTNGILGSLLNYGLARATAVFQKYCQLRKDKTNPLLKFAVFTAALLKDVGLALTNQRVVLVDEKGEFINDWNPFSGSMIGQSKFFKMYPIAAIYLRLQAHITPMLARQLIPHDFFLWLSSDVLLFSDWLAALLGEEGMGSKELTWALALIKREDILTVLSTLDGALVDSVMPPDMEHGEAFYRWLKAGIEDGSIKVNGNDAGVHVVTEGVLLEKKLFKQFVDWAGIPVNFLVVYYQVGNLLGITKRGGADFIHAAYFSGESAGNYSTFAGGLAQKSKTHHEGMVVDPQAIFLKQESATLSELKAAKTMVAANFQSPAKMMELALGLGRKT